MKKQCNTKYSKSVRIPKEWERVRLGEENITAIRKNRLISGVSKVAFIPMELIPDSGLFAKYEIRAMENVRSFTYCEKGDLLLAKITPSLENGKQGIVPDDIPNGFALATTEVFPISCKGINKYFLFYILKFPKYRNRIIASMTGTTGRQRASKESVEKLHFPLPPLLEQQKIAEVLGTVDEAIEKVDKAIEKTQRLKKGLMQELLTKGIGHKEFKDTKIGRIPKEWEVMQLEQVVKNIKNGFASGKRDENGIIQIRMNNVTTDGQLIFDTYIKVPIPNAVDKWILESGDFLFNNTNSYDLVGKSAVFKKTQFTCSYSNHFSRIKFKEDQADPDFILFHFLILWQKGYFKSVAIRHVGQSAVHIRYLLRLAIPLPSITEQKKIVEILSSVDRKLELLRKQKEKFERIKRGLMSDLLTGMKRVKVGGLHEEKE